MLYLLKSAITKQFLQENLHILALPRGESSTVQYGTRWVDPAIWGEVELDERVCLVLGDRPYERLVPVRRGRVLGVTDEAGDLSLTIVWGPFAADVAADAFVERFSELGKGRHFVFRDPSPPLDFVEDTGEDRAAWRRIVRSLRASPGDEKPSKYVHTVFLRPLSIVNDDGQPMPSDEPLRVGERYQQPLDYSAPSVVEDDGQHRILVQPLESNLRAPESVKVPKNRIGTLSFRIRANNPGPTGVKLWVTPDRVQSTTLTLDYRAEEPVVSAAEEERPSEVAMPVPAEGVGMSDRDLQAIFEVIEEADGSDQARALRRLIEDTLYPFAPNSHYLKEERGLVLHRLEKWQEACDQFAALDPDRLSAESVVAWFVSACRGRLEADFQRILDHFDAWEHRDLTDQLIDVLPLVSEERRLQLLQDAWLGAGRYRDVWEQVKDTFSRPAHILRVARLMVDHNLYDVLSPAEGYAYLCERTGSPADMPLDVLRQAVEWGLEERDRANGLEHVISELVDRLLREGSDLAEIWNLVQEVRDLSPYVWSLAAENLADALAGHPEAEWRVEACKLYVDLARVHREQLQDIDAGEGFLILARHLVGDSDDLVRLVDAEEEKWEAAVKQLESVQKWHDGLLEVRLEALRDGLSGKRAVFVGGVKRGFDVEEARRELGLAEADFIPHFHSERGSLEKVRHKIRQGKVDYVVDFIRFGAHRNLDSDCQDTGVTYVRVPRSRSLTWIVRALAKVEGIELN